MRSKRGEAAGRGCSSRERRKGRMPSCIVKGCNFSWKKKDPNIILHSFPGDLAAIKSWLLATAQATKQEFENINELCQKILVGKAKGLYRMCSQHFTMDCYYQRGMLVSLKKEALPSIFPDKKTIELKALRPKMYKPRKKKVPPPNLTLGSSGAPTTMAMGLPLRVVKLEQDNPVPLNSPYLISEHGYYIPRSDPYTQRRPWNADWSGSIGEALHPLKRTKTLGTNTEYFPGQRHKATITDKTISTRHKEVQTERSKEDQWLCGCKQESRSTIQLPSGVRTTIYPSKTLLMNAESLPTKDSTLDLSEHQPSGIGSFSSINDLPEFPKSKRSTEVVGVCDVGCSYSRPTPKEEKPLVIPVSCDPDRELASRHARSYSSIKEEYDANGEQSRELGIKPEDTDLARVEIPRTSNSSDPISENKYIVFDSCLNKLLMCCRCLADDSCNGRIRKFKKFFVGSSVSVKAECSNGHRFHMWDSQP
ncbi:uncharacterized protein LOC143956306 [Lithobates pipiens]